MLWLGMLFLAVAVQPAIDADWPGETEAGAFIPPPPSTVLFAALLVALIFGERFLTRYYSRRFGWVRAHERDRRADRRFRIAVIVAGLAAEGLVLLLGWEAHRVLLMFAAIGAVWMARDWRRYGGLAPSIMVFTGLFLVLGISGVAWPFADEGGGLFYALLGMTTIVGGVLDHLVLARSLPGPADDSPQEQDDRATV